MALAATPVDAELAVEPLQGLIRSSRVVVEGSNFESPDILGHPEGAADQAADENPGAGANPSVVQGPGEADYTTSNPARQDKGVHWIEGFQFLPDDCAGGHIVDPCQLGASADTADARSLTTDVVGPIQPYIIEASDTASTWHPAEIRLARAMRKLKAVQSEILEREFWSGTKAQSQGWTNNQYLANTTGLSILPVPGQGSAYGVVDGLAALEQAISDGSAWQRGMIHATPRLVTHWIAERLVRAIPGPPGGTLQTELGTIVVCGSAYPGTGPDTHINLNHLNWAYATPIVQVRLGQITVNQTDEDSYTVDRSANDRTIRVSRFAAATFSPCFRAAVLVNMASSHAVPGS